MIHSFFGEPSLGCNLNFWLVKVQLKMWQHIQFTGQCPGRSKSSKLQKDLSEKIQKWKNFWMVVSDRVINSVNQAVVDQTTHISEILMHIRNWPISHISCMWTLLTIWLIGLSLSIRASLLLGIFPITKPASSKTDTFIIILFKYGHEFREWKRCQIILIIW